jgi:hypothetical protein
MRSGAREVGELLLVLLLAACPAIAQQQAGHGNPCADPSASLQSLNVSMSGTSAVQLVALSGSTKIHICALTVGWGGGKSPTFSLEYGTGTNCGTGTTVIIPATTITPSAPNSPAYPAKFFVTPSGQALCYVLTGTSPTGQLIVTYVQQ